ncbi:MAG: DNA polymerase III subunit gamma/tau, partial [Alphaproteobacteria bacterium]|nr:DNA polymerase III subunit gamma/tau [Alphaproteobacteria bacterium]
DEVHMLSTSAFNALLKTLEEPPEHVKFIFATTEIRKVPVTVLSRCQRFDLRRVEFTTLCEHYKSICEKENIRTEDAAIEMIARAADGSVRDGLSLLDQAIALSGETLTASIIQEMLGLTDRMLTLDLLENILTAKLPEALSIMDDIYKKGGSPLILMQDLLELTHLLTKFRAVPDVGKTTKTLSGQMLERVKSLSGRLSMPALGKAWQILLKGITEVQEAPNPQAAAEMVLIRLSYTANLPDPADLIRKLENSEPEQTIKKDHDARPTTERELALSVEPEIQKKNDIPAAHEQRLTSLLDIVRLLEKNREALIAGEIYQYAHLVKIEQNTEGENPVSHLELRLKQEASNKLAQNLGKVLNEITGQRWLITLSSKSGNPTLAQQRESEIRKEIEAALKHPVVAEIMETFPDAEIIRIEKSENEQDNTPPGHEDQKTRKNTG